MAVASSFRAVSRRACAAADRPAASPPMTTSRFLASLTALRVSLSRCPRRLCAQEVHRVGGGGQLRAILRARPPAGDPVDGQGGPALAVLAGEVDEQDPVVVFDAAAV